MRLVTFAPPDELPRIGGWAQGQIVDLAAASPGFPADMLTLLRFGEAGMKRARKALAKGLASPA